MKPTTRITQFLTFTLVGEEYAVPILRVREILEFGTLTRVPTTPPFIRGVMNLRGSVVPVLDLAIKLRLGETAITRWTCIVIADVEVGGEPLVLGVMADNVNQVIDLAPADIEPPPPFGTRVRVDFLRGLGRTDQRFVLLLDLDRVLSADDQLMGSDPTGEPAHSEVSVCENAPDAQRAVVETESMQGVTDSPMNVVENLDA